MLYVAPLVKCRSNQYFNTKAAGTIKQGAHDCMEAGGRAKQDARAEVMAAPLPRSSDGPGAAKW
jgi:hypothetical protein